RGRPRPRAGPPPADPLPVETRTMDKKSARLRRAKSTRARIRELGVPRLSVLRTGQHVYAQVFSADGSKVLAAASTTQSDVREGLKSSKNIEAAAKVGRAIAEKAKAAGIEKVAFDRSGYRYHGRVKALADAAREGGLQFCCRGRGACACAAFLPDPPARAVPGAPRLLPAGSDPPLQTTTISGQAATFPSRQRHGNGRTT